MKRYYRLAWHLTNFVLKSFWGLKVEGIENLPAQGGAIIASNHRSYVDPPVLAAALPRELHFLAKRELFRNKTFGWFISRLNAIPISRDRIDREGLREAIEVLKKGNLLAVFPEGTRSRKDDFLEPKSGIGKLALEAGVPIVPTFINHTRHFLRNLFTGNKVTVSFGKHLGWEYLKEFAKDKDVYRGIAEEVMLRVKEMKERQLE